MGLRDGPDQQRKAVVIVGQGLLARSFAPLFADADDVVIFASGVSNSLETDPESFSRERRMLTSMLAREPRRLVYFGSCGVAASQIPATPYMQHKQDMESLVLNRTGGMVLRLPQLVGNTSNPHTLTNYLRDRIVQNETFSVWAKAERNLVDVDDIVAISNTLIGASAAEPSMISIASEHSTPMPGIVGMFERVLERKADYVMEDRGSPLSIDSARALEVARHLGIDLGRGYTERVLRKYYGPH